MLLIGLMTYHVNRFWIILILFFSRLFLHILMKHIYMYFVTIVMFNSKHPWVYIILFYSYVLSDDNNVFQHLVVMS